MGEPWYAVVPARFASTRLPGKPLIDLGGKAMVVRVAEQAAAAGAQVVVATDHGDIADRAADAGFDVELTGQHHMSGSDRVMEVATKRGWGPNSVVVNVQGDEPLIPPTVIDQVAQALFDDPALGAVTLCEPLSVDGLDNPNVVKVVRAVSGWALYFSRAPIPYRREDAPSSRTPWYRHVGLYGYRLHTLAAFVALPPSPLETIEGLEQLRLLENAIPLMVLDASEPVPAGVDTAADVERVREHLGTR